MLSINNTEIYVWEAAVREMRNPMNSWDKSDSGSCLKMPNLICDECRFGDSEHCTHDGFIIGPNDLTLMKKLISAGSDHSKFMRMIGVSLDITAPLYWWKEFDTYKVGTVANSYSTMHKIHTKEFTLDDFSHEHLDVFSVGVLKQLIHHLEANRKIFNAFGYPEAKDSWWQIIQLLPTSYNQKRTITLNYAVLRNIYHARRNHKLDEWHTFCEWIESLPYSELITL